MQTLQTERMKSESPGYFPKNNDLPLLHTDCLAFCKILLTEIRSKQNESRAENGEMIIAKALDEIGKNVQFWRLCVDSA